MECPHILNGTKFTNPHFKTNSIDNTNWECSVCKSKKSPWMCIQCGVINCGRFENGHAKAHFEDKQHSLCFDCNSFAAFCYACDDFVINDTRSRHLHQLRTKFQSSDNDPENYSSNKRRSTRSSSNDRSGKERKNKASVRKKFKNCKLRISGLRNLGNTCFMNAVLQSLSNIQQFRYYFKQLPSLENNVNGNRITSKKVNGDKVLLAEELRKTLLMLWEGSKTAISPEALFTVIWKVVPRFRGYQQQDAHEFLRYMLDRLHTELLGTLPYTSQYINDSQNVYLGPTKRSTIVTAIFGGVLQNEVTCLVCGTESKKHDPFLDLSLDISQQCSNTNSNGSSNQGTNENFSSEKCHLFDCLSSFIELEELAETELYLCPNCKLKQRSTKKFWIRRLPNVLCLHLKRFKWSNYFRTKIDTFVEFPIKNLDMSKFILSNMHETRRSSCGGTSYDLAAVIVHHGSGAGSGHYTAFATHEGCWHHFNDSCVTLCDENTVAQSKAYILFYIRRELNLSPFTL